MNPKRIFAKLIALVFLLTILFEMPRRMAGQELTRHPFSILDSFNQEAAVTDPDSLQKYSADLMDLLVPISVKGMDVSAEATHLAQAEQMARAGQGRLVPELSVVQAFNALIDRIGAPGNFRASEDTVHEFRAYAAATKAFPAVFSASRNGANCTPAEAVFLLYLLIEGDGNLSVQNLDQARMLASPPGPPQGGAQMGPMGGNLSGLFAAYAAHRRRQAGALIHAMTTMLDY